VDGTRRPRHRRAFSRVVDAAPVRFVMDGLYSLRESPHRAGK
jgi:hypothetical protein